MYRKGTRISRVWRLVWERKFRARAFAKRAYLVLGLGGVTCFMLYLKGEEKQIEPADLAIRLQAVTDVPVDSLFLAATGMAVAYILCVALFTIRSGKQ